MDSFLRRQQDRERASFARLALDPDGSPHHLAKMLGDRQPQTGTAILARRGTIRLAEGLKEPSDLFSVHADARI